MDGIHFKCVTCIVSRSNPVDWGLLLCLWPATTQLCASTGIPPLPTQLRPRHELIVSAPQKLANWNMPKGLKKSKKLPKRPSDSGQTAGRSATAQAKAVIQQRVAAIDKATQEALSHTATARTVARAASRSRSPAHAVIAHPEAAAGEVETTAG